MSVLTTEQIELEKQCFKNIQWHGQMSGNSQYLRVGLVQDLFDTIDALRAARSREHTPEGCK